MASVKRLTIIGDVHGSSAAHEKLMRRFESTLQLGDCGFDYRYLRHYDPDMHKVLGGNHDHYPKLRALPHNLGDFGTWHGVFFVRGAWSIDRAWRTEGVDWFPEEELTAAEGARASVEYEEARPDIVVTHEGPTEIVSTLARLFPGPYHDTRTASLLSAMLAVHQPRMWVFGHWHQSVTRELGRTTFRVLDELETFTLDL